MLVQVGAVLSLSRVMLYTEAQTELLPDPFSTTSTCTQAIRIDILLPIIFRRYSCRILLKYFLNSFKSTECLDAEISKVLLHQVLKRYHLHVYKGKHCRAICERSPRLTASKTVTQKAIHPERSKNFVAVSIRLLWASSSIFNYFAGWKKRFRQPESYKPKK